MKSWAQVCSHGARTVLGGLWSLALWTLWLGLVVLLGFQLYILNASELALPGFALRQIEARLAESGLRATFQRTSFDPTGRVLVEGVRLSLPTFTEPIATAGSVYVRLNPLYLLVGRIEPSEIRIVRGALAVPSLLSPTGRVEEIVDRFDATLEPSGHALLVRQLTARIVGVDLTARGTVPLPRRRDAPGGETLAATLGRRFPEICRLALTAAGHAAQFEEPTIHLELEPSAAGALAIEVTVLARAANLTQPFAVRADALRATTRLLFFGDTPPAHVEFSARELRFAPDGVARGVHASVNGRFRPGGTQFELREAAVTADALTVAGADATTLSARIVPRPLPQIEAAIVGQFLGAPLALRVDADLDARTAVVGFTGAISPRVLDVISARVGTDVRRFYDFDALTAERAEARFGAGWKFEKLTARVRVPRMNSYGVIMEDGRAVVELEPGRFYSPEAYARVGENFARGTYEHNLKTHQYRFLLDGRLQPLAISAWFRDWWPNFFRQLEFVEGPPEASVDVAGFWRDSRHSQVFVFADVQKSILRGTEFDHVRTRLFIRPAFYDGLEILATRGDAGAQGRFTLVSDPVSHDWRSLDLDLASTLDLKVAAQLLGPAGARTLAPFQLAAPPELKLRGAFAGPATPAGRKDTLRIEARTNGEFRFHNFPVHDASFVATLDGDELVLDDFEATLAGGVASGHARVWNAGGQRRLGFDFSLQDATLGQVAGRLQEFFAAQKGLPAPPPGKFVQEKASVKLDLAASAEGRYNDPLSFRGDGNVALHGAEIGEVPLLGLLSELLKFTALRFTEARGNFKIDGPRLVFPKVELRGSNSAIDAHGEYAFDKRTLDFNAKLFPFQESESLLKSVVGAVLTPLSNAFEVKLTGSLDKPEWAFVMGPTNFLRALADGGDHPPKPAPPAAPAPASDAKP